MWTWILWLACSGSSTPQLSAEAVVARTALAHALTERDPNTVSEAARAAAVWEGQDSALDVLLGDALANVLMRPADGLQLLRAHPAPEDPAWRQAVLAGTMRLGSTKEIDAAWRANGGAKLNFDHPVVEQVAMRMRADPHMKSTVMEQALLDCALLDGQPPIGREALDLPGHSELVDVASALSATRVVVGRPVLRSDPDPLLGEGPLHCRKLILLDRAWPTPVPHALVLGATNDLERVYLDLKHEDGQPWVFAASDAEVGAIWVKAAIAAHDGQPSSVVQAQPLWRR